MIDPVSLSIVRDIVAIFGVIGGLSYYVMTVRNASKARKTQTLMQLRDRQLSKEWMNDYMDLLETEWTDYEDFLRKYDSSVNRDNYNARNQVWMFFDVMGYLLHQGLIDRDSVYHITLGGGANMQWRKWKTIIGEHRKRYNNPDWFIWFEYLANEMSKIRVERGHSPETTDVDGYFNQ